MTTNDRIRERYYELKETGLTHEQVLKKMIYTRESIEKSLKMSHFESHFGLTVVQFIVLFGVSAIVGLMILKFAI